MRRPEERAVYDSDSPEKRKIGENYVKRHAGYGKERAKPKLARTPIGKAKARVARQKADTDSNEDDSWPCLVCCEPFGNSRSGEKWVQCTVCKNGMMPQL